MVSQGRTFSIYSRAFLRFCLCVIDSIDLWQRNAVSLKQKQKLAISYRDLVKILT